MEPFLQPLRTPQLLDRAVHLFRRHFLFFLLLCLPAVMVVVATGEMWRRALSFVYPQRSVTIFFAWIFEIAAYAMAVGGSGALAVFAIRTIESNQQPSAISCFRSARKYAFRIAGMQSLLAVWLLTIFFVTAIAPSLGLSLAARRYPALAGVFLTWRLQLGLFFILLIALGLVLMVHSFAKHSLAAACCVEESIGIWASLRRSRRLTKGARKRIWTMFFFSLCIFIPLASVAELPAGYAELWVKDHKTLFENWTLAASLLAMAISAPIVTIGTSLVYYDQRVRREALDLQRLIESAEVHNASQRPVQNENNLAAHAGALASVPDTGMVIATSGERLAEEELPVTDGTPDPPHPPQDPGY